MFMDAIFFRKIFCAALCLLLTACSFGRPDKLTLEPVNFGKLPGWESDKQQEAFKTYLKSCDVLLLRRPSSDYGPGDLAASVSIWQENCNIAKQAAVVDDVTARAFFERYFVPFLAKNHYDSVGLFTGYYEPLMRGSRTRTELYQMPVYALPPEVQDGVPYYAREQIYNGVLAGRGLELAWVNDPIELFFTEVQGSGRIQLDSGEQIQIGFAGRNNHPYTAIGKILVEEGALAKENVSMQTIKDWLRANPARAKEIMEKNESYVFFRVLVGESPIGAQSIALTPERSLAVDLNFLALGIPIYLDTALPGSPTQGASLYRRLFIAQDTGGAIKGPVRADIFFGFGPNAEWLAGHMKGSGEMYILLPHAIAQQFL